MKKFRILMGVLALAMVAATVTSCKKENERVIELEKPITFEYQLENYDDCGDTELSDIHPSTFGYVLDGETNMFSQWWNSEVYEWSARDEACKSDVAVVIGDVTFDLENLPRITIVEKSNNGFSFTMEDEYPNDVYSFNNIKKKADSISFMCSTSSEISLSFFYAQKNGENNVLDFMDFINVGNTVSIVNHDGIVSWYNENTLCYHPLLPIIWGAACIIAGVVNLYCNHVITTGVNNCAAQGLPAQIGSGGCSVKCIEK